MKIKFQKYQGTGNDFIIINNNRLSFPNKNKDLIKHLCDRKFGIGSDGLILINPSAKTDFEMLYFNSDGNLGSMCGNGARCSVKFAQNQKIIKSNTIFNACDGNHNATINKDLITLSMKPVDKIKTFNNDLFLDTGSPHYIRFVENIEGFNVYNEGKLIRNSSEFKDEGVNVNFVQIISENEFSVRTFERGVEDETLSCGTGVTAVALAMFHLKKTNSKKLKIKTRGGELTVEFNNSENGYSEIYLTGSVKMIFSGEIEI
ncbi:MAG: diaminopimelate epimerase [Flavobacteriaceae bacterium]|jgi:diaminopimelate epimerase|nr:diaminopimelate epimerase [Flavobacteriaceae bacterium]MBT6447512.1 diaminopimelate epimerase [Flavobacteriaceae bacterium]MDG1830632.1 diaminopimelate epimerase [Flavobacteriaceae bacterium]